MALGVTSIKPFNNQRHDYDQPNFIFSSDIPEKVVKIVRKYINLEDKNENVAGNIEFKINIELNILLARNKSLRTSDLIKDNMVCVAKPTHEESQRLNMTLPCSKSCLNIFRNISNGLFIINLTLKLLEFLVNESSNLLEIEFLKDESYGIILLSDGHFINQITNYIKILFITELNKVQDNSLVFSEENNEIGNTNDEEFSSIVRDINLDDSTLNVDSSFVDKSFTYEDDYESSLEDLILLKSNDSIRSKDDGIMDNDILVESLSKSDKDIKKNIGFLKELDNLRHNETSLEISLYKEHTYQGDVLLGHNKENEFYEDKSISIDDYMMSPKRSKQQDDIGVQQIPMTRLLSISSVISHKRSFSGRPSYGSFSMINHEDNTGLEYAFKSNVSVPSFIKEDKKFKFIKVGKVQKFVSLFEEQLIEPSNSSAPSRSPSPLKSKIPNPV